jgi:hypothetical protein
MVDRMIVGSVARGGPSAPEEPLASPPEEISALRTLVHDRLKQGRTALWAFIKPDGTFQLDSNKESRKRFNTTTTARSCIGLLAADWMAPDPISRSKLVEAERNFQILKPYVQVPPKGINTPFSIRKSLYPPGTDNGELVLNNFDIAHLADHFSILKYFRRFDVQPKIKFGFVTRPARTEAAVTRVIQTFLKRTLLDKRRKQIDRGRVLLDPSERGSGHFFVTLHSLRALAILCGEKYDGDLRAGIAKIAEESKLYCRQQCFLSQRENRHEFDSTNLIFALTVYALYDQNVDKDLCVACLEAIKGAQQSNGSWPATHPIMRPKGRPWHITSHEIALWPAPGLDDTRLS